MRARAELGTDYEEGGNDYLTETGSDSTNDLCGSAGPLRELRERQEG